MYNTCHKWYHTELKLEKYHTLFYPVFLYCAEIWITKYTEEKLNSFWKLDPTKISGPCMKMDIGESDITGK